VARRCPGFTGAELENVVNEAALLSARGGRTAIGLPDLDEAIQRVVGGPRNETHVLGPDELETIGVHEAAHAVVAAANGDGAQLHQLSIVSRGRRLGRATTLLLDRDRTVLRPLGPRAPAGGRDGRRRCRAARVRRGLEPRSMTTCTPRRSSRARWSPRSACPTSAR